MDEDMLTFWQFAQEIPEDAATRNRLSKSASSSGGAADPAAIGYEGHRRQIVDVIEAIERGRAPLVDGIEATRAVACIEAIYKSAAQGGTPQRPTRI